jgi:hypothetical protein
MGVVYRALDPTLGRAVALKTMRAGVLAGPPEVQRFYREARAIAQLHHPHIVPIFEVGQCQGQHYFTMALAPRGSLAEHAGEIRAQPRRAVELIEKIARAVSAAHAKGILHRDLKPANILLDERAEPLVSDFGLAKFLDEADELTLPGQPLGTTAYMSPEQAAGKLSQVGEPSDVWSLGVILYELLAGRRPFVGEGREDVRQAVLHAEPAPLRGLRPDVPGELEAIVAKCLEKLPQERYASMGALADALGRWLRGEPSGASDSGRPRPSPRPGRRRRLLTVALLGLAVLGAGVLLALYLLNPERALRRKLAGRTPVVLIGATGAPTWSEWVREPGGTTTLSSDAEGAFNVSSWNDTGLLLLARDPGHERYRLQAEVRHVKADDNGAAGLFWAHRQQRTPGGLVHHFYELTYNDVKLEGAALFNGANGLPPLKNAPPPTQNRARRQPRLCCDGPGGLVFDHTLCDDPGRPFRPAALRGDVPWRKVVVEVTPQGLRVFWADGWFAEVSATQLARQTAELVEGVRKAGRDPGLEPERLAFSPRQGLGLYVSNGSASFRNVVVEPMDTE